MDTYWYHLYTLKASLCAAPLFASASFSGWYRFEKDAALCRTQTFTNTFVPNPQALICRVTWTRVPQIRVSLPMSKSHSVAYISVSVLDDTARTWGIFFILCTYFYIYRNTFFVECLYIVLSGREQLKTRLGKEVESRSSRTLVWKQQKDVVSGSFVAYLVDYLCILYIYLFFFQLNENSRYSVLLDSFLSDRYPLSASHICPYCIRNIYTLY